MIFGYNEEQLRKLGAYNTASEIAQQPRMWMATYELIRERREEISRFLRDKVKAGTRVVLTGAGSSDYVGDVIHGHLNRNTQARVEAIATTDIVLNVDEVVEPDSSTVLVSFARSGNSPESIGAYQVFDGQVKDVTHLVFTCNKNGELARRAREKASNCVVLLPEETDDKAFAMTSSYTCMMLAALLFFDIAHIEENRAVVETLCRNGDEIIEHGWNSSKALSSLEPERLVYLGARCFEGLVQEMALKNMELTNGRVVSIQESVLGFRHGPKTFVDEKTVVVLLSTRSSYTNRYVRDMAAELYGDKGNHHVAVIAYGEESKALYEDVCDTCIVIPGGEIPEVYVSFNYLLYAQMLGLFNSLRIGNTPDTPNPAGTVNRVVKGVTLYPYQEEEG